MTTPLRKRLAQVLTEHGTLATPALLEDIEAAIKNTKRETDDETWALVNLFCELKHQQPPAPKTPKDYKSIEVLYLAPLREIIRSANGSSAVVVRRAVEKMRRDSLTCAYPKQLVTVALSEYDAMQAEADGGTMTVWEVWAMVTREIDRQANEGHSPKWMDIPEEWPEDLRAVIESVGWREICEPAQRHFARANFVKAWQACAR